AMKRTVGERKASGDVFPVIYSHAHADPAWIIGEANPEDVRETKSGDTVFAGRFFVNDEDPVIRERARRVFSLLKRRLIPNWSFAYSPTKAKINKSGEREIYDLDLYEIGPTLIGANG